MMSSLYRTRIAVRSTALILAVTLAVGLPLLLLLLQRARTQEEARQRATLDQLLDTVERTAQVACFVGDRRLAEEMAAGLLPQRLSCAPWSFFVGPGPTEPPSLVCTS